MRDSRQCFTVMRTTFRPDSRRGPYEVVIVKAPGTRVEVTCSPTGRSVQVHVNGERVRPAERSDR